MATCNFSRGNASVIHAVLLDYQEKYMECNGCKSKLKEYDEEYTEDPTQAVCSNCGSDSFDWGEESVSAEIDDYENLCWELKESLSSFFKGKPNLSYYPGRDDYGKLGEVSIGKRYGDVELEAKVKCKIVSGYYEGAQLDFDVEFGDGYDVIEAYILDQFGYESELPIGMQKIVYPKALKWFKEKVEETCKMVEEVYSKYSTQYKMLGTMSNGQGVYEKVEQNKND